jgi:hypothetical protein
MHGRMRLTRGNQDLSVIMKSWYMRLRSDGSTSGLTLMLQRSTRIVTFPMGRRLDIMQTGDISRYFSICQVILTDYAKGSPGRAESMLLHNDRMAISQIVAYIGRYEGDDIAHWSGHSKDDAQTENTRIHDNEIDKRHSAIRHALHGLLLKHDSDKGCPRGSKWKPIRLKTWDSSYSKRPRSATEYNFTPRWS